MKQLSISMKAVGFAVTMAMASMANAATEDWGSIDPSTTFTKEFSVPRLGSFEDFYNFSLLSDASGFMKTSITITLNGEPHSGFDDLTYALYTGANALVDHSYDAVSQTYIYSLMNAGSYYLKVSGTGWVDNVIPTPKIPSYNGYISIASSVPEPQTYAMLLAGLGILGTVMRRRSGGL
jgi:hypothetical protein